MAELGTAVGTSIQNIPKKRPVLGFGQMDNIVLAGIGTALVLGGVWQRALPDDSEVGRNTFAPFSEALMTIGDLR